MERVDLSLVTTGDFEQYMDKRRDTFHLLSVSLTSVLPFFITTMSYRRTLVMDLTATDRLQVIF